MKPTPTDELITELVNTIKETKGFVLEQAPDVIQQILYYKTMAYSIEAIVFFVVFLLSLWCVRISLVADSNKYRWAYNAAAEPFMVLFGILGSLVGFFVTLNCVMHVLKLTLAPKVWLLEYAARLL